MKKVILLTLIAGSFVASVHAADPITVNGGKVTFNGEITNGACAVSSGDVDKVVTLDTVPVKTFTTANQAANAKKSFNLTLTDCDTETFKTVSVAFSGQTDSTVPALLANTAGAGAAANVGLQIYGPDGSALSLATGSSAVTLINGENVVPFSVDYMSTAAAVTAGKVQSVANFQLTYN